MPRLSWSPQALRDMQRLYRFLDGKHPDAARRAVNAIRHAVRLLQHQPGIGRPIENLDPGFREWPIDFGDSGYVVLCRLDADQVLILTLRSQREAGYS